jgi:uncharacterized protein DUF6114
MALPRGSRPGGEPAGRAGRLARARRSWRDWRRTRPFWGGLLVAAGGGEIIATTLVSLGVTLRVGLGGVGGLLGTVIALVLVLCGILLWLSPAQRAFYSIVAVVLALATFNTINLGGFGIGMLLGITGGALGFAWTPQAQGEHWPAGTPRPGQPPRPRRPGPKSPPAGWGDRLLREWRRGVRAVRGQPGGRLSATRLPGGQSRSGQSRSGQSRSGQPSRHSPHRLPGFAALPLGLSLALAAAPAVTGAPRIPAGPGTAAVPGSAGAPGCLIIILCPSPNPSPHPSASPSKTPTPSPGPTPSPSPTGTSPSHHGHPGKRHGSHHRGHIKRTAPTHGLVAAASASTLTAGSARIAGLSYDGVAKVPRATGGPLRMMKFAIQSVTLTGRPALTISERGSTAVTTTSALSFTGHVVLYATRLSGNLLGVPLTLTPDSPESLVLRLLKPFSQHLTVTMTNVVTGHPLTLADSSQWRGFTIRVH